MVKETIVLDHDINDCKKLYSELNKIMNAYDSLPIFETIHGISGNKLFATSSGAKNRETYFAEAFNELIIEYVKKPVSEESDNDEW